MLQVRSWYPVVSLKKLTFISRFLCDMGSVI
jgi:hypothetical protein